jgi:hypothetical protein
MSTAEYLAFIPLLLYGLGLSTLLGEWKRIFDRKEMFLPYSLMTLCLTEIAIYNVFIYSRLLDKLAGLSYLHYLILLISPFLFFLVAHVFIPEPEKNTKDHFIKRMPLIYSLMALLIACNYLYGLEESRYYHSIAMRLHKKDLAHICSDSLVDIIILNQGLGNLSGVIKKWFLLN